MRRLAERLTDWSVGQPNTDHSEVPLDFQNVPLCHTGCDFYSLVQSQVQLVLQLVLSGLPMTHSLQVFEEGCVHPLNLCSVRRPVNATQLSHTRDAKLVGAPSLSL